MHKFSSMLLVFIFAKVFQFSVLRLQTMALALNALISTLLKVLQGYWFMIFASFLIMSTNGSGNVFAIYSKDIKSSLNYNQQTLNTVRFFKNLGSNVGIISGLINEVAPPSLILLIGAAANLFGYLMIYFAITNRTARPHLWQMCLYIAVGANSQSFGNTAALVTCVKNFPENRGIVLGLLKGFIGINGAVFTQLYLAICGNDSKSLVLLIAWLPRIVCIIFLQTVRILKDGHRKLELRVLFSFVYMSLALAVYLMIMIIVQKRVAFSHTEYVASATGVLLLLFLPLLVVIREEIKQKEPLPVISSVQEPKSSLKCEICAGNLSCLTSVFELPERGEDYSILQAIFSIDMCSSSL